VIAQLDVALQLLADVLRFAIAALRPTRIVAACGGGFNQGEKTDENSMLRLIEG
jgi:hypothetical protein